MRRRRFHWVFLAALTAAALLPACYRHVVRAEGPAADRYDIHEPNLKDEPQVQAGPKLVPSKTVPTKQADKP